MANLEMILLKQEEQFEKVITEIKEIGRVKERPYLVIQNCEAERETNKLKIILRNKGYGIAFCVNPEYENIGEGASNDEKICLRRIDAIEDAVVMVGESLETYWSIEMEEYGKVDLKIQYLDGSDRLYEQIFKLTVDKNLEISSRDYAVPKLLKS